jgi:NAD(P)-dependent dehydrogenase (short-subunit alcohol dehydrogenase family)
MRMVRQVRKVRKSFSSDRAENVLSQAPRPSVSSSRVLSHFVNTASVAGMNSGLGFSPYAASKFAVVNMSEGLAKMAAPQGIGVMALCPGFVRTRIWESGRNRPERYGPASMPDPPAGRLLAQLAEHGQSGLDPSDVAAQVVNAVRTNELYVFTHHSAEWRAELKERFDGILMAMDEAAARQRT